MLGSLHDVFLVVELHFVSTGGSHFDGLGLDTHLTFLLQLAVFLCRDNVHLVAEKADAGTLVIADVALTVDRDDIDVLAGDGYAGTRCLRLEVITFLNGVLFLGKAVNLSVHLSEHGEDLTIGEHGIRQCT